MMQREHPNEAMTGPPGALPGEAISVLILIVAAQLAFSGARFLSQSFPGIDRCLLASATIRLASTAKPSPPTRPAAMHSSTTRSNTSRNRSPSAEPLVVGPRERRMIRDLVLNRQTAKPAIGQVHLHVTA